jgi:hypothetical protein
VAYSVKSPTRRAIPLPSILIVLSLVITSISSGVKLINRLLLITRDSTIRILGKGIARLVGRHLVKGRIEIILSDTSLSFLSLSVFLLGELYPYRVSL